jgi:hypothetical protein
VQVLWIGGGKSHASIAEKVRQRWAILTGLSEPEARLRGLVEDDLGRILESILSGRVTGVQGDTDGVEVCRRLIDVGLEASPGKAGRGLTSGSPVVPRAGLGGGPGSPVVGLGRPAVPSVQAALPFNTAPAAAGGVDPSGLHTLQGQIEYLQQELARVPRLEAEIDGLRRLLRVPGFSADPHGRSDGGIMQMLQAGGAEGLEGNAAPIAYVQGQIDVLQAAFVALQAELGGRGGGVTFVEGPLTSEAPRWFDKEVSDPAFRCWNRNSSIRPRGCHFELT